MSLDWENIEATPLARELHERFLLKMAPGGHVDQILNGGEPVAKRQPEPDDVIDGIKRNIEAQLVEYAEGLNAWHRWWDDWKAHQPKGFRATRRPK